MEALFADRALEFQRAQDPGPQLSLREFFRQMWHIIEPGKPLIWGWHLDCLCDHAEALFHKEITRLLVSVPPGSLKSGIFAIALPAWGWTQRPAHRYLMVSEGDDLATRDALKTRKVIGSEWYRERWGHQVQLDREQWQKVAFQNQATGRREVRSIGGSITGRRGDLLVVDDPQAASQARHSAAYRAKTWHTVSEELLSRTNDPDSPIVIVQQRLHPEDVIGMLRKEQTEGPWDEVVIPWEHRVAVQVPAMALESWSDPRRVEGEIYHSREADQSEEKLQLKRLSIIHESQRNQNPSAEAGEYFDTDAFKIWKPSELPKRWTRLITFWDLTTGKRKPEDKKKEKAGHRSWVVGQLWGFHTGRYFLLAQLRGQWAADQQEANVAAWCNKVHWVAEELSFKCREHLVEEAALALGAERRLRIQIPGLRMIPVKGSKEERAEDIQPLQAAGQIYLPPAELAPWIAEFRRRVVAFPSSEPDDEVDAMSGGVGELSDTTGRVLRALVA